MAAHPHPDNFRLVERYAGVGQLEWQEEPRGRVRYEISRFQGMAASGLPVPGVLRIEGQVDLSDVERASELVGQGLTLRLEDGRSLRVTLENASGRVLTEGHGPSRCSCC